MKSLHLFVMMIFCFAFLGHFDSIWAKTKTVRKVQEVNFSEMNIKGTIRNPDGAYLVQKKGIKFLPLHEIKKDMDSKIRDAVNYL